MYKKLFSFPSRNFQFLSEISKSSNFDFYKGWGRKTMQIILGILKAIKSVNFVIGLNKRILICHMVTNLSIVTTTVFLC
jgi:hypothetical protein